MKIKVNKYQFLDNYELEYRRYAIAAQLRVDHQPLHDFETEDVTKEQLLEYIDKGYGIKINC